MKVIEPGSEVVVHTNDGPLKALVDSVLISEGNIPKYNIVYWQTGEFVIADGVPACLVHAANDFTPLKIGFTDG